MSKNNYTTLASLPIKDKVERKGNLDYLSWANAWHMLKTNNPSAQRVVYESQSTELNYFTDGNSAYVKVGICLLYTSPSPRDYAASRMPSSA